MNLIKLSEIKEKSNEELIAIIVDVNVQITKRYGSTTDTLLKNEDRAITELSTRISIDKETLLKLLRYY